MFSLLMPSCLIVNAARTGTDWKMPRVSLGMQKNPSYSDLHQVSNLSISSTVSETVELFRVHVRDRLCSSAERQWRQLYGVYTRRSSRRSVARPIAATIAATIAPCKQTRDRRGDRSRDRSRDRSPRRSHRVNTPLRQNYSAVTDIRSCVNGSNAMDEITTTTTTTVQDISVKFNVR